MGAMLSQPVTDKRSNHGEGLGLRYGLSSMQGWRSDMEDAHDLQIGLRYGLDDWSYFAVFDGHAGRRAANLAAHNLLEFILRDTEFKLETSHLPELKLDAMLELGRMYPNEEKVPQLPEVVQCSDRMHQSGYDSNGEPITRSASHLPKTPESDQGQPENRLSATQPPNKPVEQAAESISEDQRGSENSKDTSKDRSELKSEFITLPVFEQLTTVKNAIKSGFLRIDQSLRAEVCDMSGCTAVCTFISPTHLFIANCGDSRAVLYDGRIPIKFISEDHKPLNPKERARIIDAGGCATQRINGTLAVSRALGDFEFKKDRRRGPCEQLVSPEPEVTVIRRDPQDQFLILACDGIWDVMGNRELCEFVEYKLMVEKDLENVCSAVLDICLLKGSRDNMSIIIVVFENAPKFSEETLDRDRANDELLREWVRKHGEHGDDFADFLWRLKSQERVNHEARENIYLPGEISVFAKYDILREIFEKEFEDKSESESKTDNE